MTKSIFFLALLSLLFVISVAEVAAKVAEEDAEELMNETERSYKPRRCPCKCFTGHKKKLAIKQCHRYQYRHCDVAVCFKHIHYRKIKGLECCDGPSPPPSPPPKCPCYCTSKGQAKKDCRRLSPWCAVVKCDDHTEYSGGYYPKPKFQCCDNDHHKH